MCAQNRPEPLSISLKDGALRHHVSVDFLRDLIARGELAAYRIGRGRGLIRVYVSDLDATLRRIPSAGGAK